MLARVLVVLLAISVPVCRGPKWAKEDSYSVYYDEADGDVQNVDFYDSYNDEILYPQRMTTVMEAITRLKRMNLDITPLKPEENIDVKEILSKILQGKKSGPLRERRIVKDQPEYNIEERLENWQPAVEVQNWSPTDDVQEYLEEISKTATKQHWSFVYTPETSTYNKNDVIAEVRKMITVRTGEVPRRSSIESWRPTQEVKSSAETTEETEVTLMYPLETTSYSNSGMQAEVIKLVQHWSSTSSSINMQEPTTTYSNSDKKADVRRSEVQHWRPSSSMTHNNSDTAEVRKLVQHWSPSSSMQEPTTTYNNSDMKSDVRKLVQHWNLNNSGDPVPDLPAPLLDPPVLGAPPPGLRVPGAPPPGPLKQGPKETTTKKETTTEMATTTTLTTTTKTTTTKTPEIKLDIKMILEIISNLTYDYEWNLSEQFNKTIYEVGVPTCGPSANWTTTIDLNATTLYPWDFENSSVVSKCFVCGLQSPEIPRNAHCADAFAGDFLPLMPVDPKARGKIADFRKYCRYLDTQNYIENPDDPRAIYGRFTGGCAVRWTDLTGVYTQRTCRSKFRPLMGKHLASKRMAKLELALVNIENGCIISPMATLLPVSRGISLYARFHTCVCSTNWCNRATLEKPPFNTIHGHVAIVLAYWFLQT